MTVEKSVVLSTAPTFLEWSRGCWLDEEAAADVPGHDGGHGVLGQQREVDGQGEGEEGEGGGEEGGGG